MPSLRLPVRRPVQAFLKLLLAAAQCVQQGTGSAAHARVAIKCLTGLLRAVPHFNYTSDILQVGARASAYPTPQLGCMPSRATLSRHLLLMHAT